jgi:CheY-like chemotaxis protein
MQPMSILIVDDNIDGAETLAELLRLDGHEVSTAHDGLIGLEVARRLRPTIVIVDIGLPGIDGYELTRRLRSERGAAIVIAALSGYDQPDDRARSLDAGCNAHFVKPPDLKALFRFLSAAKAA